VLATAGLGLAEEDSEIGIDEKLGEMVPLDLTFLNPEGQTVTLADLVDKPTFLTLVYYHCPTICKPLLGGVAEAVEKTDLTPGEDYNIITISFDVKDSPQSARRIKRNFTHPVEDRIKNNGWEFLVADSATIAQLTDAVGFRFKKQENDFAHGTSLIVLTREGKIVRYLYGMRYMPFDIKMAVAEATKGTVAPSIARVLQYCFSYDPEGRRYVFNLTRVAGAGILLLTVGWVVYISTLGRSRKHKVAK
jgi:protein SCO1/2